MSIFDIFKKKEPRTAFDELQDLATPLIVNGYRHLGQANNCAPTSKTSDQKIMEIYQQVGSGFREASDQRNEYLPAGHMNTVVFKFLNIYEMMGQHMFNEHLKYEVSRYIHEGLREDYQQDLKLF